MKYSVYHNGRFLGCFLTSAEADMAIREDISETANYRPVSEYEVIEKRSRSGKTDNAARFEALFS